LHFASMLDLGCGTGLGGAAFRPLVDRLVGVDLSPAMAAKAEEKGIYDHMATGDLTDFLVGEGGRGARYDLVVAADVFVYVNDLAPIMTATRRVLAAGCLFAFTVETHDGDSIKLLPTLRYAHGERYIRNVLADAQFQPLSLSPAAVRHERGAPVRSLVVLAAPLHTPVDSK